MAAHQAPLSLGFSRQVGCHFLLQCMKVKSESEVIQLCPTLSDPMDCSLPGSSIHGFFQARVHLWFISITLNIDNTKNTWHLFSVEMWKLQSNIYKTYFPNHCSQIWLSNSKTWCSKSVTSCSWSVLGPILYIFKFMSMPLEKHHLPSWPNKCSLLSPHTIQFGSSWLEFPSELPATRFGGCWWCGHCFNIGRQGAV